MAMMVKGGPVLIARRLDDKHDWQVYDRGFESEAAAWEYIATLPKTHQYSVADTRTMKPKAVYSGPAGKA